MRNGRRLGIAVVLATLCAPPAAGATTWLRPLFLKRASYGESYTVIADLEDGSYVHLTLSVTNLGPGPTKGICRAQVIPPLGGPWKASGRFARESVSWTEDGPEERLTIGPCSAWAGPAASGVEARLEGGTVRLVFGSRIRLASPHRPPLDVGEERYQSEVLLYRQGVTASLALPGRPERSARGSGYLDHSRSTVAPKDLANRWVRFRALRGERALLLLGREGRDGQFEPLWACRGPDECQDYRSFRVERQGSGGETAFRVEVADGDQRIRIDSGRLLYRDAPIEELGVLGKLVSPFTGSPVTYAFRGSARVGGGPAIEGIMEVELAGE